MAQDFEKCRVNVSEILLVHILNIDRTKMCPLLILVGWIPNCHDQHRMVHDEDESDDDGHDDYLMLLDRTSKLKLAVQSCSPKFAVDPSDSELWPLGNLSQAQAISNGVPSLHAGYIL